MWYIVLSIVLCCAMNPYVLDSATVKDGENNFTSEFSLTVKFYSKSAFNILNLIQHCYSSLPVYAQMMAHQLIKVPVMRFYLEKALLKQT